MWVIAVLCEERTGIAVRRVRAHAHRRAARAPRPPHGHAAREHQARIADIVARRHGAHARGLPRARLAGAAGDRGDGGGGARASTPRRSARSACRAAARRRAPRTSRSSTRRSSTGARRRTGARSGSPRRSPGRARSAPAISSIRCSASARGAGSASRSAGDADRVFRGFGRTGSEHAFGHNGAGGQIAWADPASGVSFVYFTNGFDRDPIRQGRRGVALSSLAGDCSRARRAGRRAGALRSPPATHHELAAAVLRRGPSARRRRRGGRRCSRRRR